MSIDMIAQVYKQIRNNDHDLIFRLFFPHFKQIILITPKLQKKENNQTM